MSDSVHGCVGIEDATPVVINNRPGLTALAYRVGTHSRFKETMLARLSSKDFKTLKNLNTREDDDFSIALLDSWALVADILTFYQERIANESYLRTAVERLSVTELARLLDYQLRPGVAADTNLVFTMQTAVGAPAQVTIDVGAKIQSVPAPGQQPQTFETVEAITARPVWNAFKPRQADRQTFTSTTTKLYFAGTGTNLRLGDAVYFKNEGGGAGGAFGIVAEVQAQTDTNTTAVRVQVLGTRFGSDSSVKPPASSVTPGGAAAQYNGQTVNEETLQNDASVQRFDIDDVIANFRAVKAQPPYALVFRQKAGIFGHNAPPWDKLPAALRKSETIYVPSGNTVVPQSVTGIYANDQNKWTDQFLSHYGSETESAYIYLDTTYPAFAKDTYIVLRQSDRWSIGAVNDNTEVTKAEFTVTGKSSQITPATTIDLSHFVINQTSVYGQSEWLPLARLPLVPKLSGEVIALDDWLDGMRVGQMIFVQGESLTARGTIVAEFATIKQITHDFSRDGSTQLVLDGTLTQTYVRSTTTISANVAAATHGESVQEFLGSGDGSLPFQKFTLRQPPLTYVNAASVSGTATTLKIYVNDILWTEVPTLYGCAPEDRFYITRLGDDGKTTVEFGDGKTGARLPTGQENVRAVYRRGIGLGGMLVADQLSLLMTRPTGVSGATNPKATTGADDPEKVEDIRQNASLRVMTLDRIVSLQDYEDFARAFTGVAKANAVWAAFGHERGIYVTVAAPRGDAIDEGGRTYGNLLTAIGAAGDPHVPVRLVSYTRKTFQVHASVKIDPTYLNDKVLAAVEAALRAHFAFEVRSFGQDVTRGEVIATIQNVDGVVAVDLISPTDTVTAALPTPGASALAPAELLTLDPAPIQLEVML